MPDELPTQVFTGAADDGRHRTRQLVVGVLGWLLWAGLIAWLAAHASADALDVATFLAVVVFSVALVLVLTGLALRPAVLRKRAVAPAIEAAAAAPPAIGSDLAGEIELRVEDGVRRFANVEEVAG